LPENEVFYVSNIEEISNLLQLITYSITDRLIDRTKETERHVTKFFTKLSELCINNNPNRKRMFEIKQRFIALRDEVRNDPRDWSVESMAKNVWFTRSRFTVLYREFFGVSPSDDLIDAKIKYAQQLLETTDLSVAEISKSCGYKSVEHFIRIFSKKVNYTPYRYRKKSKSV
jgi:AraC-like DNA-binding protein